MPHASECVILWAMLARENPAARTALLRPVLRWGCGFLLGMLACEGATKPREELLSDETAVDWAKLVREALPRAYVFVVAPGVATEAGARAAITLDE